MRHAIAALPIAFLLACPASPTRAPDFPAEDTNAKLARIARQCALVASCSDEHDASNLQTPAACVDWYVVNSRDESPLATCVMRARSCEDVTRCTHPPPNPSAEGYCRAHPGVLTACENSHLYTCQGSEGVESTAVDCSELGGTCREKRVGELVERGCTSPSLCPADAPEHRCDGDIIVDCQDGIASRDPCPAGWRCAATKDDQGVRCVSGRGRECDLAGTAFCEGDVAYACVQNGRYAGLHSADCAAMGLACAVRSGRVSCVHRGPPTCATSPASCAGDDLRFCANGDTFRVSCKDLGFARCDPSGGGGAALCK